MAPLDSKWFQNPADIPVSLAKTIAAANLGYPVQRVLGQNGWDGNIAACVGIELAPDNRRVLRSQFILRGPLANEPITFQAAKIWDKASKEATVTFSMPQAAEFDFTAGTLTSEYLDGSAVKTVISKQGHVVLPTNWEDIGIGGCCFKLLAHLDKSSNSATGPKIRFTVLIFPKKVQELEEMSELTGGAGWTGIKLLEGEAGFFPQLQSGGWGCPLLPIICPGASLDVVPQLPTGAQIRHAIGKVMNSARMPTAMASCKTLMTKWKKLMDGSEDYEERVPSITWPEPEMPDQDYGKKRIK